MMDIAIKDIRVGQRHRKDLGDLSDLCASIEAVGLIHPVALTPEKKLVSGQRRLAAFKRLGRDKIPYQTVHGLDDAISLLSAERDENTCRRDFAPSEAVSLGTALEALEKPKAEERERAGKSADGKAGGRGRKKPGGKLPQGSDTGKTRDKVAAAVGMSASTLKKAKEVVASGDSDLIAEMDKTKRVHGVFKKLQTKKAVAEIAAEPSPMPDGKFRVIVADPPWSYDSRAQDASHRASNPYPSMTLAEIKALPVRARAHDDAVLWLWTTNAHLPESFAVAEAWGFAYKTLLTWVKDRMGMGDWLRGRTEHCLMCVRGRPTVKLTNQTTAIEGRLTKHSEKPEEFYALVEALCPGSKLELFARKKREGWQLFGNEVSGK